MRNKKSRSLGVLWSFNLLTIRLKNCRTIGLQTTLRILVLLLFDISKEGDPYLRTLLVQGAQHILGPFGIDCDLRRWGLKLAERGGRNGKKRAIVATARKLAVLLHHLWVSGEVYEPLHNSSRLTVAAAA